MFVMIMSASRSDVLTVECWLTQSIARTPPWSVRRYLQRKDFFHTNSPQRVSRSDRDLRVCWWNLSSQIRTCKHRWMNATLTATMGWMSTPVKALHQQPVRECHLNPFNVLIIFHWATRLPPFPYSGRDWRHKPWVKLLLGAIPRCPFLSPQMI